MNHRPSELSGGETATGCTGRERLTIGLKLLLADEPTGNLDSRTGTEIMNLVREFNQQLGMTGVMVTRRSAHWAERYAQRLIFLADGKLVSDEFELGRNTNAGLQSAPRARRL